MTIETWVTIDENDNYEVSNQGRIRSWAHPWNTPAPKSPRLLKLFRRKSGYMKVQLGAAGPTRDVHVLVAKAFHGPKPEGMQVAHKNGDRSDNRAENLSWKTPRANHRDKRLHGTNGKTLTEADVIAIRAAYEPGVTTQKQVAAQFGTTQATVSKIIRGAIWNEDGIE